MKILVYVAGRFIINLLIFDCPTISAIFNLKRFLTLLASIPGIMGKLFMKMVPWKQNYFSSVKKTEKGSFLSIKSSVNLKGNVVTSRLLSDHSNTQCSCDLESNPGYRAQFILWIENILLY